MLSTRYQPVELLLEQNPPSFRDFHRALLCALGQHLLEHVREILHSFRRSLWNHHVEHRRALRNLDLHFARLELPVEQQLAELVAGALVALLLDVHLL
jgi:hypothetical protein